MRTPEELISYYSTHDENARLASLHGNVEFVTTVHYIEKYLQTGMKILEIGAGTGRYSHYFAQNGYHVDAVELIEHNIEIFMKNTKEIESLSITQGMCSPASISPSPHLCSRVPLVVITDLKPSRAAILKNSGSWGWVRGSPMR